MNVFTRVEKKYMVTPDQLERFMERANGRLVPDDYGSYTVFNIYFDNDVNDLIRASIEKPAYKEKLRLRSYGRPMPDDTVFLELKRKFDGMVYKRRVAMTLREARRYVKSGALPSHSDVFDDNRDQILAEIDYTVKLYGLKPRVFLAYDRTAFKGAYDGELRVTFDTDIRSRTTALDLGLGGFGIPVDTNGLTLMEVKCTGAAPLWLVRTLSDERIYPNGFSKYGNVYTQAEKERNELCLQAY